MLRCKLLLQYYMCPIVIDDKRLEMIILSKYEPCFICLFVSRCV